LQTKPPLNALVDGVIFDMDGTLVNSTLDFALMRKLVGCPLGVDMLKFIEAMEDKKQREQAANLVIEHEMTDARSSQWLPGAKELVNLLHQRNIPMAIVTRNSVEATRLKIDNNQIPIALVITRENHRPKPAPDALLAVAQTWDIAPNRLMYVGDFLYDVQAGNNAGMVSCLVTHGKTMDYADQADFVFDQLDELTAALI
jgi:HAD superfamily hydrolase (TIGR01509 family)